MRAFSCSSVNVYSKHEQASAGQCLLPEFSEVSSLIFGNTKDDKDTHDTVPDRALSAMTLSVALSPLAKRESRTAYSHVPWS